MSETKFSKEIEEYLKNLVKQFPNDYDLGQEIRKLITKNT